MCNTSRSPEPTSASPESSPSSPQLSRPKPVPTAIANSLPPCRVCGGKASGFHYGLNACEACKIFFRRSLQREKGCVCKRSGKCWDTSGKRRKCAACRYNTCIKLGMSRSAIKSGRYTHMKKTINTLEVKRLEKESRQKPEAAAPASEAQEGQIEIDSSTVASREGTDLETGNDTVHDIHTALDVVSGSELEPGFDMSSESTSDIAAGLDMMISYDITSEFNVVATSNMTPGSQTLPGAVLDLITGSASEFNEVAGSNLVLGSQTDNASDSVAGQDIVTDSDVASELNVTLGSQIVPGADILAELDIFASSDVGSYIESEYQAVSLSEVMPKSKSAPGFSTDACPNIVPESDTVTYSDIGDSLDIVSGSLEPLGQNIEALCDTMPQSDIVSSSDTVTPDIATGSIKMSVCAVDASDNMMPGSDSLNCSYAVAVTDMVPRSKTEELTDMVPVAGSDSFFLSDMEPGSQTRVFNDAVPDTMVGSDIVYLSDIVAGSFNILGSSSYPVGSNTMNESSTEVLTDITVAELFKDLEPDTEASIDVLPVLNSLTGTKTDTGCFKVSRSDIQPLSNLVSENNNESLSDLAPQSHTVTETDILTLSNTLMESKGVSASDLGTLSDMMQRYDNVPDIDGGLDIVSAYDIVLESDLMSDATMVPDSCVIPGSDITMLQTITSSSPSQLLDHLNRPKYITTSDLCHGCNQEPVSVIINESNTKTYSKIMIMSNTMPEPQVTSALDKVEDFDWLLNPSQINIEPQLQSDETFSTSSQEMVARSDSVIPHRPVPSAIRNSILEVTVTSPFSLTWPTEINDFGPLVSYLVEQHREFITSNAEMPREHLLEEQRRHAKEFRLREEMFGSLSPLTLEEYQHFVQTTGMDIDNRHELLKIFIPLMDQAIGGYIQFAKIIPGFKDLCVDDQANLIKVGDFEFWFVGNFLGYNNDLKVARLASGYCFHLKELARVWDISFISEAFRLAETFQRLPLTREELILVKCLTVCASDRCQLRDKQKVEDIQMKIIQCLCHMLRKNHPREPNLLARIIDRLTELRSLSKRNAELLQRLQKWPIVYEYPLVSTLCFSQLA